MNGGDRRHGRPTGDWCIVWHLPGKRPQTELVGALSRRGLQILECDNACEAFAQACLLGSRHTPVSDTPPKTVVLLSDPDSLPGVHEVVLLAERYAPRAVCWMFDSRGAQHLRAVTREDVDRWSKNANGAGPVATPVVTLARQVSGRGIPNAGVRRAPGDPGHAASASLVAAIGGPRLRLAGEGKLPPAPEVGDDPQTLGKPGGGERSETSENAGGGSAGGKVQGGSALTDQELAMLLADEPLPGEG